MMMMANSDSQAQTTNLHGVSQLKQYSTQSSSVPLFVYRQILEELNQSKLEINQLKTQNQALVRQNKYLNRQLKRANGHSLNLPPISPHQRHSVRNDSEQLLRRNYPNQRTNSPLKLFPPSLPEFPAPAFIPQGYPEPDLIFELAEGQNQNHDLANHHRINIFWLTVAIVVIALTFTFGSFLVAKSLLNNNNN